MKRTPQRTKQALHEQQRSGHSRLFAKASLAAVSAAFGISVVAAGVGPAYAATPTPSSRSVSSPKTFIPVTLNGQAISFDTPPVMVNDRVLVPFRAILEALHATVTWDNAANTAYAELNGVELKIPIGSRDIYRNGEALAMDVPSMIVNDRTMVPVRFVAQAVGSLVQWINQGVVITTGTYPDNLITFLPGDSSVTQAELDNLRSLVESKDLIGKDSRDLGVQVTSPITVYVAQDDAGYRQELQAHGISGTILDSIVTDSGGLTSGKNIFLPLSKNTTEGDQVNTLAHEIVHAILNESAIGDNIPSWMNEGIAWREGLAAQYAGQPSILSNGMLWQIQSDINDAYHNGTLLPLISDPSQTITNANTYNVEWQDYLAVRMLEQEHGIGAIRTYLQDLLTESPDQAFQDAFGETVAAVNSALNQQLAANVQSPDAGFSLTFTVTDPSTVIGISPKGATDWQSFTLSPGTYTATISPSGTIQGLGQGQTVSTNAPVDSQTAFFAVIPPDGSQLDGKLVDSAEIAVGYAYGSYGYVNSALLFTDGSQVYGDDASFFGVTITGIQDGTATTSTP